MSTMLTFADNELSSSPISMDQLRKICPNAFKEDPTNPAVSNRYVVARTSDVIEDLGKMGWVPVKAKQARPRKGSSGIRSFHMIAFQNPDIFIPKKSDDGTEIIDCYPRIILTNSGDGFHSFKFMLGLFRLVCSNGLVICTDQMINMSILHINYSFEELRKVVNTAVAQIPNITCKISSMKERMLSPVEKIEMATEVAKIRSGAEDSDKFSLDEATIQSILSPCREEDKGNDLWSVFNVCQEKLIKGGYSALNQKGKTRKQRTITSIQKENDFNQKLWAVAEKYMTVAA